MDKATVNLKKPLRRLAGVLLPVALLAAIAAVPGGAAPQVAVEQVAAKKRYPSTINIKPPKGFKRYRAPGAYNVNPLIYPRRDIFGAYVEGTGNGVTDRDTLGRQVGRNPSMIKRFYTWGQPYDQAWARSLWTAGAIPQVEMESWASRGGLTMRQIAQGKGDAYLKAFARDVRKVNVPMVFSIGHEFNGDWYPWGECSRPKTKPKPGACSYNNTPQDFVKAWRRMHTIFKKMGATNTIWMWSVNQIHARPEIRLKPWYPGNAYVDWVGAIGYFYPEKRKWIHTFGQVFNRTLKEISTFSVKPVMLAEVGTASKARDVQDVKNFLVSVARRKQVIGFIWFNIKKEENWRIDASPAKLKAFRYYVRKWPYAFNPKKP